MKISFLIPYSSKDSHKNNAVAQMETCFFNLPNEVTVHYLVAEGTALPAAVSARALSVPVKDGYFQVLAKTVSGLEHVLENVDPDFVVRGNSSNYYQIEQIKSFLERLERDADFYGGKKTSVTDEMTPLEIPVEYAGGSGVYLSNTSAQRIIQIEIPRYNGVVDDVAIGHFMARKNVALVDLSRNDVTDAEPLRIALQTRLKSWESDERTVARFHATHAVLEEKSRSKQFLRSLEFFASELLFFVSKKRIDLTIRLCKKFRPL